MTCQFKEGDRVKHRSDPDDEGTFVECSGKYSRVVWDNDGDTECNRTEYLFHIPKIDSEQEAVMFLLNLGYTVSKNS